MRVEKPIEEKKPEVFLAPQPLHKIVVLLAIAVAGTALFWLAWHHMLETGVRFSFGSRNITTILSTLGAFCLMCCAVALAEILVTRKLVLLIMSVVAAATIFIFFPISLWSCVAGLLTILALIYWKREIRVDLESRLKFMPQRVISSGLKPAITLLLLAISFSYYGYLITSSNGSTKFIDGLTTDGTNVVQNIMLRFYKDKFSPHMSLDQFITNISNITEVETKVKTGTGQLDAVVAEGLTAVQRQAVVQARNEFLDTFKITATGNEEMQSVVRKIVSKNVERYITPYEKFIPALLALSLFFLLNFFNFLYSEIVKSASYLFFYLLVGLKFISVKKVQVEAEKVSL